MQLPKLPKKFLIIFFVVISIAIVILLLALTFPSSRKKEGPLSVVYLTSSDIYIGKISLSPFSCLKGLQLSDAYLLQVVRKTVPTASPAPSAGEELLQPTQPQVETSFQLVPLKDALWAPKNLCVNRDQIIFFGPVEETSKVAETIRGAGR